eukprot:scaffold27903_cov119-Isochrysis_galbana.AAC.1
MPLLGCWCLAPESTLRHLWTSQNVRRRSVLGSGVEFTGKGVRCACGGDACAYRLVGCWDVVRPLGAGHIVVLHRGLDVGERRCLPTGARRVRNPHRSFGGRWPVVAPSLPAQRLPHILRSCVEMPIVANGLVVGREMGGVARCHRNM